MLFGNELVSQSSVVLLHEVPVTEHVPLPQFAAVVHVMPLTAHRLGQFACLKHVAVGEFEHTPGTQSPD